MTEAWKRRGEIAPVGVNHMATKTALIVAYYFPPIATSGSMRPLGFCRYLEKYGWRARVLTTDAQSVWPPLQVDAELCRRLPSSLRVDRVPHNNPLRDLMKLRNQVRQRFRRKEPRILAIGVSQNGRDKNSGHSISRLMDLVSERVFSFPDPQCFWLRPAVEQLAKLSQKNRPDVVLATGKPWTNLLVGKSIAQQFGIPFIADFRDPWVRNPVSYETSLCAKAAMKLERNICAAAFRVITTTAELRDRFVADYPELSQKFVTITNGFDDFQCGHAANSRQHEQADVGFSRSNLEISHFGTVYGNRNPTALLQAIKELFTEKMIGRGQVRVRFVGAWELEDSVTETLVQELEREGLVVRERPIFYAACLEQMARAGVLLLLQPGYPLQIPAKVFEYIACGRPVLVLGGEGATANLVTRYGLGTCCQNKTREIKSFLLRIIRGEIRMTTPRLKITEQFSYRNLTGELAAVLESAFTERLTSYKSIANLARISRHVRDSGNL